MKTLSQSFFNRNTIQVAKDLLGKYLVHETKEGKIVGKIVETEAYLQNDPACHAARGKTRRNAPMFGPPGNAYVYFTYGMYHCFNVSTRKEDVGEAVLIRALEPIQGINLMETNRKHNKNLCNGPARLVIATGISMSHNNHILTNKPLYIASKGERKPEIHTTTRIGISQGADLPYRFYIKDNKFISKK